MSSFSYLAIFSLIALASLSDASAVVPRHPRGPATTTNFLSALNDARRAAGVPPLAWNATLSQRAKAHTNWLRSAGRCDLKQIARLPSRGDEALTYFRGPAGARRWTPADAVWMWADERRWYDRGTNTCAAGRVCGDYTQVVWRSSRQVGCAVVVCASGDTLMACEYYPGGNYRGERPY